MRAPALALLAAAALALGAAPSANASAQLPERCESWFGGHVLALVCDPRAERPALVQLPGSEPYQDGDRVTFDLRRGSRATVLAFRASGGDGVRNVVVAPFDSPAQSYDVEIDGALARVTANTGQVRTYRLHKPRPKPAAGTPEQAVRSFVRLIQSDMEAACGLLAEPVRTLLGAYRDCPGLLAFILFDQEVRVYPDLLSIRVRRVVVERGDRTIARVRLVYRFDPDYPGEPRVLRVWATTPVVREGEGWRVVLPQVFSPMSAVTGDTELTPTELRRHLRRLRQGVRTVRAWERRRRLATRPVAGGPTGCPGPVVSAGDRPGDVELADGGDLARRQDESGVDLLGAARSQLGSKVCFELRFRTPLPAEFGLSLGRDGPMQIEIQGDMAVAVRDPLDTPSYFPVGVTIAPARDSVQVLVAEPLAGEGVDVEAWTLVPAIDNAYLDELQARPR